MSTTAALRKELNAARQEKLEAQRLLSSGRWGKPGYLRNSFDGVSTEGLGFGQSLVTASREGGQVLEVLEIKQMPRQLEFAGLAHRAVAQMRS